MTLPKALWSSSTYTGTLFTVACGAVTVLVLNYAWAVVKYRRARCRISRFQSVEGESPPVYPAIVPFLGNAFPLAWDMGGFLLRATYDIQFSSSCLKVIGRLTRHDDSSSYHGKPTSTRIKLLGSEIYVFQDREAIIRMMKHPSLASPMSIIIMTLRFLFGMPEGGLAAYRQDDSGPLAKPFPGSKCVLPEQRIDHLLHQSFNRAFSGPGLGPTTQRFRKSLRSRIEGPLLDVGIASKNNNNNNNNNNKQTTCWKEVDDFFETFGKMSISSLTQAIYGPLLLQLHPDLVDDLWAYDEVLPWLARGVPRLIMPGPYQIRDRICCKLKDWYVHARCRQSQNQSQNQLDCVSDAADGSDEDPAWGSRLVSYLQQVLHVERGTHDDNAMSSHDLALLWASNFNAVSAATLAAFHIFRDPLLLARVRAELATHFDPRQDDTLGDPKRLLEQPLLSAVYAETLRLYVHVFFMASSPHDNVVVGRWKLPRNTVGVVSSGISHMDDDVWNTGSTDNGGMPTQQQQQQQQQHPLNEFWADRFLVDPADPTLGGPLRHGANKKKVNKDVNNGISKSGRLHFSTEGLDGVWIPYGGGASICPGRFLAKHVVLFTCALLITEFDIEPLTNKLELDPWRYGLGMARPKHSLPVRMRRRIDEVPGRLLNGE